MKQSLFMAFVLSAFALVAGLPAHANWQETLDKARGQSVSFNAWGGDPRINSYIAWIGRQVKERYDITLNHVKLSDAATAVGQVLAEQKAGRDVGGSIDLIWINGENFASMKQRGLLYGPFAQDLPNFALLDTKAMPTILTDFTLPTQGYESPWGTAQLNFIYDSAMVPDFANSSLELLDWTVKNPGLFTYPMPPNFMGSTFLKQVLLELHPDAPALNAPPTDEMFAKFGAPLWDYLEALHPNLWRKGKYFPQSGPQQRQLLEDSEIAVMISFTPTESLALIKEGLLPETVRATGFSGGTIGNTHFVAIPYNASAKEAAQVVANFMLSVEAQTQKQDIDVWGDASVLPAFLLPKETPKVDLGPTLSEPHPGWMERLEAEWIKRYGN